MVAHAITVMPLCQLPAVRQAAVVVTASPLDAMAAAYQSFHARQVCRQCVGTPPAALVRARAIGHLNASRNCVRVCQMARDELLPMVKYFLAGSAALHAPPEPAAGAGDGSGAAPLTSTPGDRHGDGTDGRDRNDSDDDSSKGGDGGSPRDHSSHGDGGSDDDGASTASTSGDSDDASQSDGSQHGEDVAARRMRRVVVYMDAHASECALRQQSREAGAGVYSLAFLQVRLRRYHTGGCARAHAWQVAGFTLRPPPSCVVSPVPPACVPGRRVALVRAVAATGTCQNAARGSGHMVLQAHSCTLVCSCLVCSWWNASPPDRGGCLRGGRAARGDQRRTGTRQRVQTSSELHQLTMSGHHCPLPPRLSRPFARPPVPEACIPGAGGCRRPQGRHRRRRAATDRQR